MSYMVGIFYINTGVSGEDISIQYYTSYIFVTVNTEVSEVQFVRLYKLLKENYKIFLFVFSGLVEI